MKKIALVLLSIFVLTACSTEQENENVQVPQLGFRHFTVERDDNGNMPTEIKTQIPNSFRCTRLPGKEQQHTILFNDSFEEGVYTGDKIFEGEENLVIRLNTNKTYIFKKEAIGSSADINDLLGNFSDIYRIELGYFCADKAMIMDGGLSTYE
ncbi:hypothetical protein KKA33_03705 [Patescibacteria group bacterium]|nr:hypothetical protein [Patescibacteria group bacterium]